MVVHADTDACRCGGRRRGNSIVCEHDAFGCSSGPTGGDHQRIALLNCSTDPHRSTHLGLGSRWQPLVDRERSIAVTPDALQLLDETRAPWQVDRN